MLQADVPDDYVIGTGVTRSVAELCAAAFSVVNLDWQSHVKVDKSLFRPAEVDVLVADATKARTQLGWTSTVGFDEMVRMMVEADVARHRAIGI